MFAEVARGSTAGAGPGVGSAGACEYADKMKVRAPSTMTVGELDNGIVACAILAGSWWHREERHNIDYIKCFGARSFAPFAVLLLQFCSRVLAEVPVMMQKLLFPCTTGDNKEKAIPSILCISPSHPVRMVPVKMCNVCRYPEY